MSYDYGAVWPTKPYLSPHSLSACTNCVGTEPERQYEVKARPLADEPAQVHSQY